MLITPISGQHVEEIARLHCSSLTGLLSQLGVRAAKAFYAGCVETDLAVGFVCLEDGAVRGYELGTAHPDKLKQAVLRKRPFATLAGLCLGIVRRPLGLVWLVKSLSRSDEGSYDRQAAELTYLAVAPACRHAGIGKRLVDAFTGAMRDAGIEAYELSVDDDNLPAIAFYERLGFRLIGRYREFGILHRRYRFES
jgi:ribosomal protein S18 acetylase RimI-like enzyme